MPVLCDMYERKRTKKKTMPRLLLIIQNKTPPRQSSTLQVTNQRLICYEFCVLRSMIMKLLRHLGPFLFAGRVAESIRAAVLVDIC